MSSAFLFGFELISLVVIMIGSLFPFDEEGRPATPLGVGWEVWEMAVARIGCFLGEMESLKFCQPDGEDILTIVYYREQEQFS